MGKDGGIVHVPQLDPGGSQERRDRLPVLGESPARSTFSVTARYIAPVSTCTSRAARRQAGPSCFSPTPRGRQWRLRAYGDAKSNGCLAFKYSILRWKAQPFGGFEKSAYLEAQEGGVRKLTHEEISARRVRPEAVRGPPGADYRASGQYPQSLQRWVDIPLVGRGRSFKSCS